MKSKYCFQEILKLDEIEEASPQTAVVTVIVIVT